MTLELELQNTTRCLVGFRARDAPQLGSVACWSDGEALWIAVPARSSLAAGLRAAPSCAIGIGAGTGLKILASGAARVFTPDDLVGLLFHGPIVTAAMAALALRHPREVTRGWPLVPARIAVDEATAVEAPLPPPGIAPALPEIIPADIRRDLSGIRQILMATEGHDGVQLAPATWGAGFTIDPQAQSRPGASVAVAAGSPGGTGVVLTGELDTRGALLPAHASWWGGGRSGAAPLPPAPRGAVRLPD
ncbi:MAG: hypothetical protein ACRDZO_17810 [Egibacteraceae bacterium]